MDEEGDSKKERERARRVSLAQLRHMSPQHIEMSDDHVGKEALEMPPQYVGMDAGGRLPAVQQLRERQGTDAVEPRPADAVSSEQATHAAAAQGKSTTARPLPHADRIQASFGPQHDVASIRAHIDPGSTAAMDAEAYATGNDVVFAKEPDVETAAHEAAHVVQQARA
jgi:hypothetical protein